MNNLLEFAYIEYITQHYHELLLKQDGYELIYV